MSNPFERFYDTEVKLLSIKKLGAYSRNEPEIIELDTIMADVQPYGGGLALKEYGLESNCRARMFCSSNEYLKEGNYAEIGGERYRIIYAASRSMGAEALLEGVRA